MAYGTKYQLPFASHKEITGDIYIKEDAYTGAITTLRMIPGSFEVVCDFSEWFDPILKQKVSFTFVNDAADFFDYIDLFELEEKKFQVLVVVSNDSNSVTVFEGFLNADIVQQKYNIKSEVTLTATNYVSKLKHYYNDAIDVLQKLSIIDLITGALTGTDKLDPVRVNAHLLPQGHTFISDTVTCFNRAGVYTEAFWENNIDRNNSLEVLEIILGAFDCFLYWWDNYWHIERYRDVYNETTWHYQYAIGSSYGYGAGVTPVSRTNEITDIWDLIWMDEMQTIKMTPGFNELKIHKNLLYFLNLLYNDFTGAIEFDSGGANPGLREWQYLPENEYNGGSLYWGMSIYNIINATYRSSWSPAGPQYPIDDYNYQWGIATRFKCTILDGLNMNITWKATITNLFSPSFTDKYYPERWQFQHYYYLKHVSSGQYIYYNTDTNEWIISNGSEKEMCNVISTSGIGTHDSGALYKCIPSISIPIGDLTNSAVDLEGDQEFILMVGLTIAALDGGEDSNHLRPPLGEYIGDIVVTVDGVNENNYIKGELNNNVLESKEVEVNLIDLQSLNYRNVLLTGPDYDERTVEWIEDGDSSAVESYSLARWLLLSKFQLFNKNRKKITGRIQTNRILRPFELFYDSKDSNLKYLLVGYTFYPDIAEYEVVLMEYNNEDTITLI